MTWADRRFLARFLRAYRKANRINLELAGDRLNLLEIHKAARWLAGKEKAKLKKLNNFMESVWRENDLQKS